MKTRKAWNAGSIGTRIWMHEFGHKTTALRVPIDDAIHVIREAYSKGVTFFDTAEV